jgi:Tfp pilus assembly protein PilV
VTLSTRTREEAGFGLVELLIAMTVMVVGITAIVAAMSSGIVAVNRAAHESTAAAVADRQMEEYRKVRFAAITPSSVSNTVIGPDGRSYRVDKAIGWKCTVASPTCTPATAALPAKLITIIVFDLSTSPPKELFRETSTFDQATG